jgi:hypothetical protein
VNGGIKMYKKPYVIAEVGCNHMGSMEVAHEMIETPLFCSYYEYKIPKAPRNWGFFMSTF